MKKCVNKEAIIEKLRNNKLEIIMCIVMAICIYITCKCNMFAQDEYNYSNFPWTNTRITSFKDIIESQISVYNTWSGRVLVLGLSQIFLMLNENIYSIVNAFIFILYIYMISKVMGIKKVTGISIACTLGTLFFTSRALWEKFIWMSGSLNYMWTVTLMLVTMYYLYNIIIKYKKITKKEYVLILITSFLAGWSQENTAFVLGMFIIIIGAINCKKIFKLDRRRLSVIILATLLFGIGSMILIFSPR